MTSNGFVYHTLNYIKILTVKHSLCDCFSLCLAQRCTQVCASRAQRCRSWFQLTAQKLQDNDAQGACQLRIVDDVVSRSVLEQKWPRVKFDIVLLDDDCSFVHDEHVVDCFAKAAVAICMMHMLWTVSQKQQ